jgi:hypothetical protein
MHERNESNVSNIERNSHTELLLMFSTQKYSELGEQHVSITTELKKEGYLKKKSVTHSK